MLEYVAGCSVERQVDRQGKVSLYNRPLYVAARQAGQKVWVHLDPERVTWVVADRDGQQLREQAADCLNRATIRNLQVTQQRRRRS